MEDLCATIAAIQERCLRTVLPAGGELTFSGAGTQKVQEEVQRLFPGVEVMRMDTDTISAIPHP